MAIEPAQPNRLIGTLRSTVTFVAPPSLVSFMASGVLKKSEAQQFDEAMRVWWTGIANTIKTSFQPIQK
jgi:hypothetical protein